MYHVGGNHSFSIAAPCTLCQVARSVLNQCHGIRRLRPHTVNCPSHIRLRRVKKHCQVQTTIYIKFTSVGRNTRCTPKRVVCCAGGQASGKRQQAAVNQRSTFQVVCGTEIFSNCHTRIVQDRRTAALVPSGMQGTHVLSSTAHAAGQFSPFHVDGRKPPGGKFCFWISPRPSRGI